MTCKCTAWDSKLYVLGGEEVRPCRRTRLPVEQNISRGEVYMMDLAAGQWKWEQLASMLMPRSEFGCAVVDGKIYALGGISNAESRLPSKNMELTLKSEVYDIQKNSWSSLLPMTRTLHSSGCSTAAVVGEELCAYNTDAMTLEIYNSAKEEWRSVDRFWPQIGESVFFMRKDKFCLFTRSGIDVYDEELKSWVNQHTHSFDALLAENNCATYITSISPAEDELLLTAFWLTTKRYGSFQSKGFDSEMKEIAWERAYCCFNSTRMSNMCCSIQL